MMIGLGAALPDDMIYPLAVFPPQPNVRYQIDPVKIYYFVCSDCEWHTIVDQSSLPAASAKVDFAIHGRRDVTFVHDDHGNLHLKKEWE